MKARVIRGFKDIKSKKRRVAGEIIEDITEERFNEINGTRHGELIVELDEEPNIEEEPTDEADSPAKEAELKEAAEEGPASPAEPKEAEAEEPPKKTSKPGKKSGTVVT